MPSFVPDKEGAYTIRLIVNDGRQNSLPDAVVINVYTTFSPPVANAGTDQNVLFGNDTVLDGTASTDFSGHGLTYKWTIDSGPAGSAATLDDPTKSQPVFTPDKKGMYVISLVVNDTLNDSNTDWVVINVYNNAPIARAGVDIVVPDLGGTAYINGSASSDPDGTPLSFEWTLTSKPMGSTAELNNANIATPTLNPDKKGAYLVKLVVSDGDLSSSDMIMVTCSNQVPVAEAGDPITIPFLGTAQLNGSGSDPDNDPITYSWSVTSAPEGSTAAISNPNIANPTFTPDIKGVYELSLIVTDNDVPPISSAPDTVTITTTNHAPAANAGADININLFGTAHLSGSGSDIDGDPIVGYAWTIINTPFGSTATISDPALANPTFTPDKKGDYQLGLIVFDGTDWSLVADTVMVHVFNNRPIAVITGPAQPTHYANRTFTLSGSSSYDPDGDLIRGYRWDLVSKPDGSSLGISNQYAVSQTFTLDKPGTYLVDLYVNDGIIESTAAEFTITTPTATYTTSFESGSTLDSGGNQWVEYNTSNMGTIGTTTSQYNSGSYSYVIKDCNNLLGNCGSGYGKLTNYTGAYVMSVTYYAYTPYLEKFPANGAGLFEGDTKQVDYPGVNSWTQYSWAPNRAVTDINFRLNGTGGATWISHVMYFDDISVTVWQ